MLWGMETLPCLVEDCDRPLLVKSRQLCRLHYHRWKRTGDYGSAEMQRVQGPDEERWLSFVEPQSPGCWIWTGPLDKSGYGQYDTNINGQRKNWRSHRWVYTFLVRELEDRETLDHLCRVHSCVNPDHLDPVAHALNVDRGSVGSGKQRKTHCKQGHLLPPFTGGGRRQCLECTRGWNRKNQAAWRERQKAA